jgi:hypothetical protein
VLQIDKSGILDVYNLSKSNLKKFVCVKFRFNRFLVRAKHAWSTAHDLEVYLDGLRILKLKWRYIKSKEKFLSPFYSLKKVVRVSARL